MGEFNAGAWQTAIGTSGTARSLADVMEQNGLSAVGISKSGLARVRQILLQAGHVDKVKLNGLREDRRPVLAGGFAIMQAVFDLLGIQHMQITQGALRDGVLYDLLGRRGEHDIRDHTVQTFQKRYHVDVAQAQRVAALARTLATQIGLDAALIRDVHYAGLLHETGRSIAHASFHKHSAIFCNMRYARLFQPRTEPDCPTGAGATRQAGKAGQEYNRPGLARGTGVAPGLHHASGAPGTSGTRLSAAAGAQALCILITPRLAGRACADASRTYRGKQGMAKRRARSDHQRTSRIKHHLAATKAGAQPGTILYVGKEDIRDTDASLIEFGPQAGDLKQTIFTDSHPELPEVTPDRTLWVNVHGLANAELLQAIGHHFSLHPLVMEDIFNTQQRSKVEIYSGYLFITARLVRVDAEAVIQSEQISIVLGRGFVLTFQEEASGTFKGIRDNLQNEQSQLRRLGADYLVYSLMDKLVDRYFAVLESLGERMEEIEDDLEMDARPKCLTDVQTLRRALLAVKRGLWPLREMVNTLQRDEPDFFRSETQLYLRDVYDHTVQLIESTEHYATWSAACRTPIYRCRATV